MALFRRSARELLHEAQERYIAMDTYVADMAAEDFVLLSRLDGSVRRVERHLAELLPYLDRFRTASGHGRHLGALGYGLEETEGLTDSISELEDLGFLIGASELESRLIHSAKEEYPSGTITTVGWITRNRPDSVLRSVRSYSERLAGPHEPQRRLLVLDDTQDAGLREVTEGGLQEIASVGDLAVEYVDAEAKRRYVAALLETPEGKAVDPGVIDFALFDPCAIGYTTGANRNALLFAAIGELSLSADDDTVAEPVIPFRSHAEVAVSSAPDPFRMEFFSSRAKLLESIGDRGSPEGRIDPLAAHEALLGRALSDCIVTAGKPKQVDLREVDPALATRLLRHPHRIGTTVSGSYGDSGMGYPLFILGLLGESRDALMRSEESYRSAFRSREVVRAVPAPTLSPSPLFMTLTVGLDGRRTLPPFFPVLRNEDEVFRRTLAACDREAFTGFLAQAIYHDPPVPRAHPPQFSPELRASGSRIITTIVHDWGQTRGLAQGAAALEDLGLTFLDIGTLTLPEFEDYLRESWLRAMGEFLVRMEILRERFHGQPEFWDRDVHSVCESLREALVSGRSHIPADLGPGLEPAEVLAKAQDLVRRFGALLCAWPKLLQAAATLKASAISMGRTLG